MKNKLLVILAAVCLSVSGVFAAEQSLEALEKFRVDGEQFYDMGDLRAAQKTWEVGLEISKSAKNQVWLAYFMLKLGELHGDIGNYATAFEYFEQAVKTSRSQNNERNQAIAYLKISRIYAKLEKYKDAISYNQKAIDIFKELGLKEGLVLGFANAGGFYAAKGEHSGALAYLNEANHLAEELGNKNLIGNNLLDIGRVNRKMGDFEKSKIHCEQALKAFREDNNSRGIATALMALGEVYVALGNYGSAVSMFEESLDIAESVSDRTLIGSNLANLGMVYKNVCDYGKSLLYIDNSMRYSKDAGNKESLIENYARLGSVNKSAGYCEKALTYFTEAIKVLKEMDDKHGLVNALANLGTSCAEKGLYSTALTFYQETIEIKKKLGLPYQDITAQMIDIYLDKGDMDLAEKSAGKIKDSLRLGRLNLYKKNYTSATALFETAIQENTENRRLNLLFPSYCGLAESSLGLWEYGRAKEIYTEAINLVEAQREGLNKDERHEFYETRVAGFRRSAPFEGMVRTFMSTNNPKDAFTFSETLKLAVFSEAAPDAPELGARELSDDNARKEKEYLLRIAALRREMNAMFNYNRKDEYWAKERELKALKVEHDEFVEALRLSSPRYTSVMYQKAMKPQDLDIKPNEVLLEFEVTSDVVYLFMYKGYDKRFTTRTIPKTRKEIEHLVIKCCEFFKKNELTGELAVFDAKYSREAYDVLFGDMLKYVPKGATLVIVPDEALGAMPFSALVMALPEAEKIVSGKFTSFSTGVEYLSDRYRIQYAQSATALTFMRSLEQDSLSDGLALAVCDPVYSEKDPRGGASGEKAMSIMSEAIRWWRKPRGNDGEFERSEAVAEIAKSLEAVFQVKLTVLSGLKAKEESVVGLPLSKYKYITFGTHVILDSAIPWFRQPVIVLSQVGNNDGYNGFLTLGRIMQMKIPAETVTLPDCESPEGSGISGQFAMDMGRAFQFAGTRSVLMTIWPNHSKTLASFNAAYLENIKAGKEPAEAVEQARAEIRGAGMEHPYYWAQYIVASR